MPGDLNRVFLIGLLTGDPRTAGKGVRLWLRTSQHWTGNGGEARSKEVDHDILVLQASLVAFAAKLRSGDRVLVEGALESGGTVVLGGMLSSIQLLRKASEGPAS